MCCCFLLEGYMKYLLYSELCLFKCRTPWFDIGMDHVRYDSSRPRQLFACAP
jgi:hypothetical protein